LAYYWCGNVRELRNAVERAMILAESTWLTPQNLPIAIARPESVGSPASGSRVPQVPGDGLSLEENEKMLLTRALEKTGGNQTQAARLLHITRDTLRYKMKKFSLR
jgi:two-component system response regulator AtoC